AEQAALRARRARADACIHRRFRAAAAKDQRALRRRSAPNRRLDDAHPSQSAFLARQDAVSYQRGRGVRPSRREALRLAVVLSFALPAEAFADVGVWHPQADSVARI